MTNSLTLTSRAFVAPIGKTGKVSTVATRATNALNGASGAVQLGIALTGRGVIAKQAQSGFLENAVTLDALMLSTPTSGADWRNLFAALTGQLGNLVQGDGGKNACFALLELAQVNARALHIKALNDGTAKQLESAQNRVTALLVLSDQLGALAIRADVAKQARIDAETANLPPVDLENLTS